MKLITVHRITIAFGIAFSFFFAGNQYLQYQSHGGARLLVMSVTFGIIGVALLFYLVTLRRHVKLS